MGFSSPLVSFTFLLPIFLFLLSSATALNITRVLGHYPQFSSFNTHLSRTLLADSINGGKKNKVTVLAVDNSVMSKISSESTEEEVERILRLHLLRGYYRERNLLELSSKNASLPTFHPEGPVQVKAMKGGGVGLGVAAEGSELSAKLVKPIFHHAKDNISVLQISDLLQPQNNVGNCIAHCPAAISRKDGALPIDTNFTLPGPLPSWPAGKGFASGTIDLGGLLVQQVTSFTKIWAIVEGGPDDLGVTFFEPSVLPEGYFMLGSYAQPNNRALYGGILGDDGIGLRNDFDKSDKFMNIGASFSLARAQYLGAEIVEPAWMNYSRQWGPTVNYDFAEEMQKAVKILPGKLKDLLRSILEKLPAEILGEEGPTGPNMKPSWLGDEM
ncbi:hypothetical protein SAY86_025216 [Trapa natans]|uniref:FAS1 domain-containing protein n=1 Tax=Trapa natans TaxID=22666 RepID=A0AAN7MRN7_TRANT|nr:hypothetical protein SAY86_025216 [Trapa natans]